MKTAWIQLGRLGDVINMLPLVKMDTERGNSAELITCYDEIAEATTWCKTQRWSGHHELIKPAIEWAERRYDAVFVSQVYSQDYPIHSNSSSYAIDSWDRVKFGHLWGTLPLELDNRNKDRESRLAESLGATKGKILVSTKGVSSTFHQGEALKSRLRESGIDFVDWDAVQAEKFYDMAGILETVSGAILTDSAPMHLARAVPHVPIIALTSGTGSWYETPPIPGQVLRVCYRNYDEKVEDILNAARRMVF